MRIQEELSEKISEVRGKGNGAVSVVPYSGDEVLRVSYLWGVLRIDKLPFGVTIPLPERGVGGGDTTGG